MSKKIHTPAKEDSKALEPVSTDTDVTIAQSVDEREAYLTSALNSIAYGVFTIESDGTILSFNSAAERMFGYTASEVIGKNIRQLIPTTGANQHDNYLQCYQEAGIEHVLGIGREVEGKRKNENRFPLNLSVAELPGFNADANCKQRLIATCADLSRIKQHDEQLQRHQKMDALGTLTGGIAHDYNNMLGIILGYTDLLDIVAAKQPALAEYIKHIRHAAQRGASLTNKLLDFSRQKNADATVLDINTLLRNHQLMLEKILTIRIQLKYDLEQGLWPVALDSGELEDAIINLSINAMHAMGKGGKLTIQTRNLQCNSQEAESLGIFPGRYVSLSLTDTGCGMDKATQAKIFDPFYTTKGTKGTGLGLSQVYGFVERSLGTIKVYSEPGHGTRFTFYFPECQQQPNSSQAATSSRDLDLRGTETILVVDDEPELQQITEQILSGQGYRVLTAGDGIQALAVLKQTPVDLLISDVIMPAMDGYQLAARARQDFPELKIQMVSGFSGDRQDSVKDESLLRNMLYKPYAARTLLVRIRQLLDKKGA